jgi:hypothetical protein
MKIIKNLKQRVIFKNVNNLTLLLYLTYRIKFKYRNFFLILPTILFLNSLINSYLGTKVIY